jgi:hypothetical protein
MPVAPCPNTQSHASGRGPHPIPFELGSVLSSREKEGVLSKSAEYRVKAGEHTKLAKTCQSEEAREIHASTAALFFALADVGWPKVEHATAE